MNLMAERADSVLESEESGAYGNYLDAEFTNTMRKVEAALLGAARSTRIRGEQWLKRLSLLAWAPQDEFRRDRNLHAELLLQCVEEGRWMEPLDRHPPDGPLPRLPPHVACALRRQRSERSEIAREASAVSIGVSQMPNADQDSRRPSASSKRSPLEQMASSVSTGSSQPSAPASLAHVAAAAVGQATPCAYAPLVARVKYLEDENRRLRKQLNQARSECNGCRGYMEKPSRVQSSTPCARGRAQSFVGGRSVASKRQQRGNLVGDNSASVPSTGTPVLAAAPLVREDWQASTRSLSAGHLRARHRSPFRSSTLLDSLAATESLLPRSLCTAGRSEVLTASPKHRSSGRTPSPGRSELLTASPRQSARSAGSTPRRASPARSPRSSFVASAQATHTSFGRSSPSTPPPVTARQPRVRTPPGDNPKSSGVGPALGPPPPEDDTEGFLRYLDAFQERAGRLCETSFVQAAQAH